MGASKQYKGYRSFQYLDEGRDYKKFNLAKELRRVPSSRVEVSEAEEQRVQDLIAKNIVVSIHDHPVVVPEADSDLWLTPESQAAHLMRPLDNSRAVLTEIGPEAGNVRNDGPQLIEPAGG